MANDIARQVGVLLDASATSYDTQEAASAARLGGQGLAAPAGEVPAAPRDIARLIELGRGGPGPRAWEAVETNLRSDASTTVLQLA